MIPTPKTTCLVAALTLLGGVFSTSSSAAPLYWDTDSGTADLQAGSGTWALSGFDLWNPAIDGSGTATSWIDGSTAVFGSSPAGNYTVTIGSPAMVVRAFDVRNTYTLTADAAVTLSYASAATGETSFITATGNTLTVGNNVTLSRTTGTNGATHSIISGGSNVIIASGATITSTGGHSFTQGGTLDNRGTIEVKTGGTFSSSGYIALNGHMLVSGGTVSIGAANNLVIGQNNVGSETDYSTLTIDGGSVAVGTAGVIFGSSTAASSLSGGVLNLNGGVLETSKVTERTDNAMRSTVNFNGGILRVRAANGGTNNADFLLASGGGKGVDNAFVQVGGAIIDTNGNNTTIGKGLDHDTALGATRDGGLTKQGIGSLTLSGMNTYTGDTTINTGSVIVATTGGLTFQIQGTGLSNQITGVGDFAFNGTLVLDFSLLGTHNPGDTWVLVANAGSKTYGAGFGIISSGLTFERVGDIFTSDDGAWSYDLTTHTLSTAAIPEPSTWAALFGLAALGLAALQRRRRL